MACCWPRFFGHFKIRIILILRYDFNSCEIQHVCFIAVLSHIISEMSIRRKRFLHGFGWRNDFFFTSTLLDDNRKWPLLRDNRVHYPHARRLVILHLFLVTALLEIMTGMGKLKDVSMKRDEATLIPRFIPRNCQSIICRSFLKARLSRTHVHVQWICPQIRVYPYIRCNTHVYCVNRRWRVSLHDRNILKRFGRRSDIIVFDIESY